MNKKQKENNIALNENIPIGILKKKENFKNKDDPKNKKIPIKYIGINEKSHNEKKESKSYF